MSDSRFDELRAAAEAVGVRNPDLTAALLCAGQVRMSWPRWLRMVGATMTLRLIETRADRAKRQPAALLRAAVLRPWQRIGVGPMMPSDPVRSPHTESPR